MSMLSAIEESEENFSCTINYADDEEGDDCSTDESMSESFSPLIGNYS